MTPLCQRRFKSKPMVASVSERTLGKTQRGESYTKGVTSGFVRYEFLSITPLKMTHEFVWSEE
jgi:hypothetical protein